MPPTTALMQKIWDAWGTLDVDNVAPFYAKDPDLVFYDLAPLRYVGWQDYAAGAQNVLAMFHSVDAKVQEGAMIHVAGDHALGIALVRLEIENLDGSAFALIARWTVVWEKRGSEWLILHEHVSAPLDEIAPPSPQATEATPPGQSL
jgi:ketosteroid isomerase-like protein